MAKEYLGQLTEDIEVGNETVEEVVGDVVKATPNSGGLPTYIRLQLMSGLSYLWQGNVDDFNFDTSNLDPETGNDWEAE